STPVQVLSLTGVQAIAAGNYHSLALKSDGTVWAWGYSRLLEGGSTATQVLGLVGVRAIAVGADHGLALK
ncbi:MAG: hypothetical protein HY719_07735, partial [Planctomycetes bacterium]|nr:hypothetical protein [Planctomycetota bacterium]